MKFPRRLKTLATLASCCVLLTACGSEAENTVTKGPDGMPKGDTGWAVSEEGGALRLARQIDQLTLTYLLEPKGQGLETTMTATAKPCLGGKGEQSVSASFAPYDADDATNLAALRDRMDSLVSQINDRCNLPAEVSEEIGKGFDGLYFRTAEQRAAVSGT